MERVYSQRKRQVKEEISKEKVKKRTSGKVCDINKQTIYTALKSKIESMAHYALSPHRATTLGWVTIFEEAY